MTKDYQSVDETLDFNCSSTDKVRPSTLSHYLGTTEAFGAFPALLTSKQHTMRSYTLHRILYLHGLTCNMWILLLHLACRLHSYIAPYYDSIQSCFVSMQLTIYIIELPDVFDNTALYGVKVVNYLTHLQKGNDYTSARKDLFGNRTV